MDVVSAYAPQVQCEMEDKDFRSELGEVMERVPRVRKNGGWSRLPWACGLGE